MILALRTDQKNAELYLLSSTNKVIDNINWQGDRQLADTILNKIQQLLKKNNLNFKNLTGIIIFTGTGSFTGLRVGTAVANTIAYSLSIPVVSSSGENWIKKGFDLIKTTPKGKYVTPKYHSEPNITTPKNRS